MTRIFLLFALLLNGLLGFAQQSQEVNQQQSAQIQEKDTTKLAQPDDADDPVFYSSDPHDLETRYLTDGQGLYQALKEWGCDPGWLSKVMEDSEIKTLHDIHFITTETPIKVNLGACRARPDPTTTTLTAFFVKWDTSYTRRCQSLGMCPDDDSNGGRGDDAQDSEPVETSTVTAAASAPVVTMKSGDPTAGLLGEDELSRCHAQLRGTELEWTGDRGLLSKDEETIRTQKQELEGYRSAQRRAIILASSFGGAFAIVFGLLAFVFVRMVIKSQERNVAPAVERGDFMMTTSLMDGVRTYSLTLESEIKGLEEDLAMRLPFLKEVKINVGGTLRTVWISLVERVHGSWVVRYTDGRVVSAPIFEGDETKPSFLEDLAREFMPQTQTVT